MLERRPLPRTMMLLRLGQAALCALLLSACPNSGLDAYNKGDEGDPYEEDQGDYEPPIVDPEECATLCAMAIDSADSALGCSITCGVDVWPDFAGTAGAYVSVLAGGGLAGEIDGGSSCDFVSVCPEQTECVESYGMCLAAAYDAAQVEYCSDEYAECAAAEQCSSAFEACQSDVDAMLETCIDAGTPIETCEDLWQESSATCVCLYNACLAGSSASECSAEGDGQSAPLPQPPPPQQTGARSYRVQRSLLDYQLQRLQALDAEVMLVPTRDAKTGRIVGLKLRSVDRGEALYTLGLRNDDVLLTVNGTKVLELAANVVRLQQLYAAPKIVLELRRKGALQTLTYQLVH